MIDKLQNELKALTKSGETRFIYGIVGAIIEGRKRIEVPNRDGFIYVRLRDNPSEFIHAYNGSVQNVYYNLPVVLQRQGNRYVVMGRDSLRYSQWNTQDASDGGGTNTTQLSSLLRHGSSHSFHELSAIGGGDISWIYSRQFLPGLVSPYNDVSPNVYISSAVIKNKDKEWKYIGNTGTANILQYKPTESGTRMVLVCIDSITGNPELVVNSGVFIQGNLTGTSQYLEYVPDYPIDYVPLALIRLESGTSAIGWDNITDMREFAAGGGNSLSINGSGDFSNINFPDFNVTVSGSVAVVEYSGKGGVALDESVLFSVEGRLATGTNMANLYLFTKPAIIDRVYLYAKNAGITGSTTIDVNLIRSGTVSSIFTNPSNRPTLQFDDINGWTYGIPDIKNFGEGDVLFLDIDDIALNSEDIVVSKMITGSSNSGGVEVWEIDGSARVVGATRIKFGESRVIDGGGGIAIVYPDVPSVEAVFITGSEKSTTSPVYVDFDTDNDLIYNKRWDDTSILIRIDGSIRANINTTTLSFGINVNSTDYDILTFKNLASSAETHFPISGVSKISGLAAGEYNFRLRWKRNSGAGTVTYQVTDFMQITAQEVR